jgi:formiminoglutamate deiminase
MIHASCALLPDGWRSDVRVTLDDGRIGTVASGVPPAAGDVRTDCLLPGLPNVHSHAFQRGFAGLAQRRGTGRDSFWTWREAMYRFALSVTPEDVQALAQMAYVEMLEAGFTRVGEFHYLHHDRDGTPYDDPAELSARIFAAAAATGIALTHLPVFYAHGGFGPVPPGAGQRRFVTTADAFADIVAACDRLRVRRQDRVGLAPHSLRAAATGEIASLTRAFPARPVHIHVAEQEREVEECLAFCGRRPVALLFETCAVDGRWCLVHATHLEPVERRELAASGAVAGLCPVTEADLGDGTFGAVAYLEEGGRIALGTDSNIAISAAGEMRMLEYGQRLLHRGRNVLADGGGSTAARIFGAALSGGAQALGVDEAGLAPGAEADLVALGDPLGLGSDGATMLDRWIFGPEVSVTDVWAAGAHVVRGGRHIRRDEVAASHASTLRRLLS